MGAALRTPGAIALLSACLVLGCQRSEPIVPVTDEAPRAALVAPDDDLAVGRIDEVVIAVRTASGHRVLPIETPELTGAEVLGVRTDVREIDRTSWLHRIVVQVRPLQAGELEWPQTGLIVEAPGGGHEILLVGPEPLNVDSVLEGHRPDRQPFGLRQPPAGPIGGRFGLGVLLGAGAALLAALLLSRVRAGRASQRASVQSHTAFPATRSNAARVAIDELSEARSQAEADPRAAANRGAAALRDFVSLRFGHEIQALTTEELSESPPHALARDSVDGLISLLRRYDEARFEPTVAGPDRGEIDACLEATAVFVERWAYGAPAR